MADDTEPAQVTQRLDEWAHIDEALLRYHVAQWAEPKRSTQCFAEFIRPRLFDAKTVIDLGCGAGAATSYIASRNEQVSFVGIDYSAQMIAIAQKASQQAAHRNVSFETGDWFDLRERADVDGVMSLQTLSWLPEFERPLKVIFDRLRPRWLAVSSLFYDGDISCTIEVNEHVRERKTFYNVYSLPALDRFARRSGYHVAVAEPFRIDVDIPQPPDRDLMGTYTVRLPSADPANATRLQISGPLLMNWQFVVLERDSH
jgi:SAM-dependent methyltransferase